MNRKQKLKLLEEWSNHHVKITEVYDAFTLLFGADSECKALAPTWEMFNSYTDLVAKQLGDNANFVTWFAWDNYFGDSKLEARAENWKKPRSIVTLKDLLDLIENKP